MDENAERDQYVTGDKDDLLLLLKCYNLTNENLECKLSEQDIIFGKNKDVGETPRKNLSFLENGKRLVTKTNEELIRKYVDQNTIVQYDCGEAGRKCHYWSYWAGNDYP